MEYAVKVGKGGATMFVTKGGTLRHAHNVAKNVRYLVKKYKTYKAAFSRLLVNTLMPR